MNLSSLDKVNLAGLQKFPLEEIGKRFGCSLANSANKEPFVGSESQGRVVYSRALTGGLLSPFVGCLHLGESESVGTPQGQPSVFLDWEFLVDFQTLPCNVSFPIVHF